ncbi:MAG: hypothetical protein DMG68_09310, partial [Acidobacteria bacterium]
MPFVSDHAAKPFGCQSEIVAKRASPVQVRAPVRQTTASTIFTPTLRYTQGFKPRESVDHEDHQPT